GNHISMYSLFVCNELGLAYSPCDPEGGHGFLKMKDEDIIAIVQKYENRAGFYGIYLADEPHEEYVEFAEVFHLIQEYNPHLIPHLNLLPPYNFGGIDEYFTEFAAVAGGNGRMRYLTYDHYPFMWGGGFNPQIYSSINRLRKAGLFYNADTGYYMQSMIITGSYPLLYDNELRYNASLGMAYGMKNYKWFVALTPVGSEGTNFETGFVAPDFTPADNYEALIATNKYVKQMGTLLGNRDAIEVYHTNNEADNLRLPEDFIFAHVGGGDAIYTLYESLDGKGQQHIVISNKSFRTDKDATFTVKVQKDVGALSVFDPLANETTTITVGADSTFTLTLKPGQCVAIILPEGVDVSRPEAEKSENLALNKPVYVSSSSASFWQKGNVAAYHLTNGDPTRGYWVADRSDRSGWLKLDLLEVCEINTLKMYMCTGMIGGQRCKDFTVYVSEDGVNYTKVAKVVNHKWDDLTVPLDLTFDTVKARYIRIESDSNSPMGVGEIEVYG
ncbi:MAG: discoidin domain-containing protein, partial [Clostridia bacterium]|nr:discoidin domain-containing protein [Clostridia bacterium]